MPKPSHSIPIGNPSISDQPHQSDPAWRAWQAHLDAGRIGSGTSVTAAQLARLAHNERILCGSRVPRIWE
jgi:hypothetical protein